MAKSFVPGKSFRFSLAILIALALFAQTPDSPANRLPPKLRERGAQILAESREAVRAELARALARLADPAAVPFLADLMEHDASALIRKTLIDRLGQVNATDVQSALARIAVNDVDAANSLLALERLHEEHGARMRSLLDRRLRRAEALGDKRGLQLLARGEERWIALERGTMLPSFLQSAPPLFQAPAQAPRIRVVAFGDFGDGSEAQKTVASAVKRLHERASLDFGVTLGDNFYGHGATSPSDPYWQSRWESLYGSLSFPFFATLGNHDWSHPDSPAAEILYSASSRSWRMPASYYTFTAGPVQFFALDTSALGTAQLLWLEEELEKSRSRWKVVYGHHPIYSAGRYQDSSRMIGKLLPLLRNKVQVYFAGHDHDMQALKPDAGVHFYVVGGGGAALRGLTAAPHSLMANSFHGFAVFEADERQWSVTFYDTGLNVVYRQESRSIAP